MRKKVMAGLAGAAMLTALMAGAASAQKEGPVGESFCSGATGPDGVVDPSDVSTWNNPGEIISFVAPNQLVGGSPDAVGVVATYCNPNLNPLP